MLRGGKRTSARYGYGHVAAVDGRLEIAAAHGRCGDGPSEREGAMRPGGARARYARGGATQRAFGLAKRHALLFRSRRRAAGNPRLATLTPHVVSTDFSPSTFLNARR